MKFWRCVVLSTEFRPCARERASSGVGAVRQDAVHGEAVPAEVVARRVESDEVEPGVGPSEWLSSTGSDVQKNGLSSVLKSARSGIAEPTAYVSPSAPLMSICRREVGWIGSLCPIAGATEVAFRSASDAASSGACGRVCALPRLEARTEGRVHLIAVVEVEVPGLHARTGARGARALPLKYPSARRRGRVSRGRDPRLYRVALVEVNPRKSWEPSGIRSAPWMPAAVAIDFGRPGRRRTRRPESPCGCSRGREQSPCRRRASGRRRRRAPARRSEAVSDVIGLEDGRVRVARNAAHPGAPTPDGRRWWMRADRPEDAALAVATPARK